MRFAPGATDSRRKTDSRDLPPSLHLSHSLKAAQLRVQQWANLLPVRSDLHLTRKIWHMVMGLIVVSCYMSGGVSQSTAVTVLGAFLAVNLVGESIRLRNPVVNELCIRFFGPLLRTNEVHRVSGMPYFVASALVAIAVFPKPVAVLALLYLALGDPIASLFGILYSRRSVRIFDGKSLHGTAAAFAVCALATWLYLRSTGLQGLNLIRLTLLGGFAGALAELLPLELDDNFTIPIVSGFILWLGFIAIHFI